MGPASDPRILTRPDFDSLSGLLTYLGRPLFVRREPVQFFLNKKVDFCPWEVYNFGQEPSSDEDIFILEVI